MATRYALLSLSESPPAQPIDKWLEEEGFEVHETTAERPLLDLAVELRPQLCLIDVMSQPHEGPALCYALRLERGLARLKILLLTMTAGASAGRCLGWGEDLCLGRPLTRERLVGQVNALLRPDLVAGRTVELQVPVTCGPLRIDPAHYEAFLDERALNLTPVEFRILYLLAKRPDWVYTRQRIIDRAQGQDVVIAERAVDVHVVALRKKLGEWAGCIQTVRGVGYRFVSEPPAAAKTKPRKRRRRQRSGG